MHLHHDHVGGHDHDHDHENCHCHDHDHEHCGCQGHHHDHDHGCCGGACQHSQMEELTALMKYMVGHNAAHAKELADLASKLQETGNPMAYEQVLAAVSDFEKGNMRLAMVLAALEG